MAKKEKKAVKKAVKKVGKKKPVNRSKTSTVKKKSSGVGWKPSANVAGGKSYSQVAREVLSKTNGNRAKATAKLRELGCSSAPQVVAKMAVKLGYGTVEKGSQKKTVLKKKATPAKKASKNKKANKKTKVKKATKKSEPEVLPKEDLLDEEFEEEFEEEEKEEELGDEDF